jgi:hypothetical protein
MATNSNSGFGSLIDPQITPPTTSELQQNRDLYNAVQKRQSATSAIKQKRWLPEEQGTTTTTKSKTSPIMKVLNTLSIPLYGVVGGIETAIGKGSEKGLLANIESNIKEKGTMGDVLKKYNVPYGVSAPLGFALDVALDPLIWATGGTSYLVPKAAYGLVKGGPVAAAKGVTSRFTEIASTAAKHTPFLKNTTATQNLLKMSQESGAAYNELVGRTVEDIVARNYARRPLGAFAEDFLKQTMPEKTFASLDNMFRLKNKSWWETEKIFEESKMKFTEGVGELSDVQGLKKFQEANPAIDFLKTLQEQGINKGQLILAEGEEVLRSGKSYDLFKVQQRLAESGYEDLQIRKMMLEKMTTLRSKDFDTGLKWYDDVVKSIRDNWKVGNYQIGKKISDAYSFYISNFKIAKVGLSPTSWMNAVVGNAVMAQMSGFNIANPIYMKTMSQTLKLLRSGKVDYKFLEKIKGDAGWAKFTEQYPNLFKEAFGIHPALLDSYKADQIVNDFHAYLVNSNMKNSLGEIYSLDDTKRLISEGNLVVGVKNEMNSNIARLAQEAKQKIASQKRLVSKQSTRPFEALATGADEGLDYTQYASEVLNPAMRNTLLWLEKKGATNKGAKLLYDFYTKPMSTYGMIDQAYKFSTTYHMSINGLTQRELSTLQRFVKIAPSDITNMEEAAKTGIFKINALKAGEASQEIFMNYAAMPAAVKVLRTLPFMGAPFASFMYAMTVKSGKTLVNNPAVFNKVNNFLHEFAGEKTPLEKQALDTKYYEYYKKQGMFRLPFFDKYPIYLNIENMVPYYTLNMLQPVERDYENTVGGAVMATMDKLPFFKTPEGQIMWDYFVQPLIIRDSNPQGFFGQQLYPEDASAWEKAFLIARTGAESLTPGVASYLGLVTPPNIPLPGKAGKELGYTAIDLAPSWRWRDLANARYGQSSAGIQSKESVPSRLWRRLMASVGLPIYQVKPQYTEKK